MTPLAATATHASWSSSWPLILGLAVLAAAGWLISLRLWPWTRCRWCEGTGQRPGPGGRSYGRCRFCKGSPERLRPGARLVHRGGRPRR